MIYVVGNEFLHDDKFAAIGENVTIACHGSDSKPVMWRYKNPVEQNVRYVYDRHHFSVAYVNKCTINESTYDLTIHNVEVADAGEYWCTEDEGFGVTHVTKLFVTGIILPFYCRC